MLVGLPLWIFTWLRIEKQARDEGPSGMHARRSIVRKAYLYLALFASVIGGMAAAVALVFQLLSAVLTGNTTSDFLPSVLKSLQLLLLFAVVLLYHLYTLRRDGAARRRAGRRTGSTVLVIGPAKAISPKACCGADQENPHILVSVMAISSRSRRCRHQAVILPASLASTP
jgi:hypothetical protein